MQSRLSRSLLRFVYCQMMKDICLRPSTIRWYRSMRMEGVRASVDRCCYRVRQNPRHKFGWQESPDDERYLPATINNTLVQVNADGRSARVSGQVLLSSEAKPAAQIWVAGTSR